MIYEPADIPSYQLDAIAWLEGYCNTQPLQDLLRRCRFSQEEVEVYRSTWAAWLKPKNRKRGSGASGIH